MLRTRSQCRVLTCWTLAVAGILTAATLHAEPNRAWVDPPERYENTAPIPGPSPMLPPEAPPAPSRPAPRIVPPDQDEAVDAKPPDAASPERPRTPPEIEPEERPRQADRTRRELPPEPQEKEGPDRQDAFDPAAAAEEFAAGYLRHWSAPNVATLEAMQAFYATDVVYHGRRMTMRAVLEEKRRFIQRWPVRNYEARPESMRTKCDGQGPVCMVRTAFDFRAASPQTGKVSQGSAILLLEISFATGRPLIVAENSLVTSRLRGARREASEDDDEP